MRAKHVRVPLIAACLGVALLSACASDPARQVAQTTLQRTGHHVRWYQGTTDDDQAAQAVKALLSRDLSADAAVEIAFLRNAGLQARFEEIGIAQADLVQAGLLRNPIFAASWRFPDRSPRRTDAEYSVTGEFLDLLMIPLRRQMAEAVLTRTQAAITHDVLSLAVDVKAAFYAAQTQQATIETQTSEAEIEDAAETLAQAQHDAGTISDLELAHRQVATAQAKSRLLAAQVERIAEREKVNRLLGLWGADTTWKAEAALPPLPAEEPSLDRLESLALAQRMDFVAARTSLETLGQAVGVAEDFRYLATVRIGIDTEREPGGPNLTGPTLELELPIFDNGDARIGVMRARYRQARQEFIQLAINIRSQTREARDRMIAFRELAVLRANSLVPLHTKIVALTQLQTNAMARGPYDLLAARHDEVIAQREAIEALRDYWLASTELERAVGGRLTPLPPASPTSAATTAPTSAPSHDHSTHGDMP